MRDAFLPRRRELRSLGLKARDQLRMIAPPDSRLRAGAHGSYRIDLRPSPFKHRLGSLLALRPDAILRVSAVGRSLSHAARTPRGFKALCLHG